MGCVRGVLWSVKQGPWAWGMPLAPGPAPPTVLPSLLPVCLALPGDAFPCLQLPGEVLLPVSAGLLAARSSGAVLPEGTEGEYSASGKPRVLHTPASQ